MEIQVQLGSRSYPVLLKHSAYTEFSKEVRSRFGNRKIALITNTTLAHLYKDCIAVWEKELSLVTFVIPDGEKYKNLETWSSVLDFLLQSGLDRKSVVCALGGGVVGDIVGFAAASFLRGVAFVQIPTTLLAMVDSSVGGKTGVDHALGKNLIGAFHQPSLVWLDTGFLKTLPQRDFISGYGELYKYAFLGSKDMFDFVIKNHDAMMLKDADILLEGIKRSVQIKATIVEQDETETKGLRALLNLGHTFAHAIERFYNFENILHGEAVLLGIQCAFDLGKRVGSITENAIPFYNAILAKCPPITLPICSIGIPDANDLYAAMFTDKKMENGKLTFVVPAEPGTSVLRNDITKNQVCETLVSVFER